MKRFRGPYLEHRIMRLERELASLGHRYSRLYQLHYSHVTRRARTEIRARQATSRWLRRLEATRGAARKLAMVLREARRGRRVVVLTAAEQFKLRRILGRYGTPN